MTGAGLPPAIIGVQVGPGLDGVEEGLLEGLSRDVAREIDTVIAALGIPARAEVTVTASDEDAHPQGPIGVTIDGRRCRYPGELIHQVAEVVRGSHLAGGRAPEAILQDLADSDGAATTARVIAAACREIVKVRASWLLGDPQATAYVERLGATTELSGAEWPVDRIAPLLRTVLDLWIPISDVGRVAAALASAGDDPAEDLIASLRPDRLEVELAPAFLRVITASVEEDQPLSFPFVRTQLYEELGLHFPDCHLMPADDVGELEIRFRINALRTTPVLGAPPGMLLVNDTPDRLRQLGVEAVPAVNPATGSPGSMADVSFAKDLAENGLTTWDSWEHLLLTLAAMLRRHAHRLVDTSVVEGDLGVIDAAFPALGRTARSVLPVAELTRLARALLRELVSVRDLRRIVSAAIEWHDPEFVVEPRLRTPGDGANGDLEAFVRVALARQLHQQHASLASDTVVAYVLEPAIEALVEEKPLSEDDRDRVVDAMRAELAHLPETARAPHLLTTARARSGLVEAISDEFPRLRVLAFEELVPRANVQPVARISLTT